MRLKLWFLTREGKSKQRVVVELVDTIVGILQNISRTVTEAVADIYEGERNEKQWESGEPECSLPAHSLERGDIVLRDELLLVHHLRGHDHLGAEDEQVPYEDAGGVILTISWAQHWHWGVVKLETVLSTNTLVTSCIVRLAGLLSHHIRDTHCHQASDHEDHASPLEPGQSPPQEDCWQDPGEDDDSASQHLEGAGVGEGETNVLDTGGGHVTQSWRQEYLEKDVDKLSYWEKLLCTSGLNLLGALSSLRSGYGSLGCLVALHLVNQNASIHIISPRNMPNNNYTDLWPLIAHVSTCGLEEWMIEGFLSSIHRLWSHGVRPLDWESVEAAKHQHHSCQTKVNWLPSSWAWHVYYLSSQITLKDEQYWAGQQGEFTVRCWLMGLCLIWFDSITCDS